MNKNPWIKRKKEKDEGWEFVEHGFKIKDNDTDRDRPAIFRPGQDPHERHPHNKDWHTTPGGRLYFESRPDRSKDWTLKGIPVSDRYPMVVEIGYSVPEGGIDE